MYVCHLSRFEMCRDYGTKSLQRIGTSVVCSKSDTTPFQEVAISENFTHNSSKNIAIIGIGVYAHIRVDVYAYLCICKHIYIYIYRERKIERERERGR